ncbi:MAG: peptidoglycan-binding domain-containing protein [Minisyncoccia bacterium]
MNFIHKNIILKYTSYALLATVLFFCAKSTYAAETSCVTISQNLRFGMTDTGSNSDIYLLQNFLYKNNYLKVKPTGYFGNLTKRAVTDFQFKEKIYTTGFVGTITRSKISSLSCKTNVENTNQVQATVIPTPTPTTPTIKKSLTLPYNSTNFFDWSTTWGNSSTSTNNVLALRAGQNTNGAGAFLPNTADWKNYKFLANIHIGQASVILISRYVDENNFIGCTFAGKYIEIIQRLNGNTEVMAFTTVTDYPNSIFFNFDINLLMQVNGKAVGCSLIGNSDNVSFNNINDKLSSGGVGIQIWDTAAGVANVKVKSVQVEQI